MFEEPRQNVVVEKLKAFLAACGLAVFAAGAALFFWQGVLWLRTGRWPRLSTVELLSRWKGPALEDSWLLEPTSWFGLHKLVFPLLSRVPASVLCLGVGGLLFAFFISSMDRRRRL